MGCKNRQITFMLGSHEVMYRVESLPLPYNKILICPKCLKSAHLGKWLKKDKWSIIEADRGYRQVTVRDIRDQ